MRSTRFFILCLMSKLLWSCSSVSMPVDAAIVYRMDMDLEIGGRKGNGMLVAPNWKEYEILAKSAGKLDLFIFSTCAREEYQEEAWDKGWFKTKLKTKFQYKPNPKIEKHNCDMRLAGAEKIKGRHSAGYIVFEESQYTMPAKIICNGKESNSNGSSACQSRSGILVQIEFSRKVRGKSPCADIKSKDEKTFRVAIPRSTCAVGFQDGDKNRHKLILRGYDQIPLRGD